MDLDCNLQCFYIKMGISISVCTAVLSFCILNHVFFYKFASIPYSTLSARMLVKQLLFVSHILKHGMIVMLYDKLDNTGSAEKRKSGSCRLLE